MHVLFRVAGADVPGNTTVARTIDCNGALITLVETRAVGGFTVTAPSQGPVHPTGEAWERRAGGSKRRVWRMRLRLVDRSSFSRNRRLWMVETCCGLVARSLSACHGGQIAKASKS